MAKSVSVVLIAVISLDGKITESASSASLEWASREDREFFVSKTKEIGVVVMGRKTFDTIGKSLAGRRVIVMTRSPQMQTLIDGVEFTDESPEMLVARLASEGVRRLALAGGASLYRAFMQGGLVNELFVTVEPVLLGEGIGFLGGIDKMRLSLLDVARLGEHGILAHYKVN